jgi:drug/metabolite transporter (DMT)-like permease
MADAVLLALSLLWATTFTLVKEVLAYASPGVFLSARFGLAALALLLVWAARRDPLGPGFWRHAGLLGLAMLAGFCLQTLGLRHTTPARSGFISGLCVLVVPLAARGLLGRRVRASTWAGVALALLGLLLLTRPFGAAGRGLWLGDLLTLGSAVAFGLMVTFTSEWAPRHPLTPLVAVQVLVTLAGVLPLTALEGAHLAPAHLAHFTAVVAFTGLVLTAGAFFLMSWGQRHTTAARAALIFSLEPAAAALFAWARYGEPLGPLDWTGGALMVLGVIAGEVGGVLEARGPGRPARPGERERRAA